ncbi:hypothetical protein [Pseudoramibacter sp.]|jgi:ethanolamine utilization protein|uniref:hypothetical protein n=1 Tax=Pseudoramibacter sp. TaxID=2034862 RepID=UPI0025F3FCF2|nr:hypothetical protein [Pseudoramibacter sp.]MCH4071388.1 hypothetical protein [Pseudoramibacter sp.]MCH4105156.1 hypothetical protein [Pseudoramibacter sp.]
MDFDQLVSEIASRVAKRVEAMEMTQQQDEPAGPAENREANAEQIVHKKPWLCAGSKKIQERNLQRLCEPAAQNEQPDVEDHEGVLITSLSVKDMCRVVEGIGGTPVSDLLIEALLAGKRTAVLKEGVALYRYQGSAPVAYYRILEEKLNRLMRCGVIICPEKEAVAKLSKSEESFDGCEINQTRCQETEEHDEVSETPAEKEEPGVARIDKHVITDSDLIKALVDAPHTILIPKRAILTDVVKETLDEKHIQVSRAL